MRETIASKKAAMAPMISAFLFYDASGASGHDDYIAMKIKIRQMLKDSVNRKVLTEILMDLRKDLSGDVQEQLFNLYQDLGLHKDAFRKLQSWRWEIVSKGIEELTEMRVTDAYTFIRKFVNDRRSIIRKQGQLATVTLMPEGIDYFLDTAKFRISEWQQLSLLDVLRHKEDFNPPQFKAWLISRNKDVVLFSLRLIKFFNQNDTKEELIELARHKSNLVKLEAIECIDKFHVYEALDTLKAVFKKCNTDVKIAILSTIGNMGSEADFDFLNTIARKDRNFIIRTKALGTINAVSPGMIIPTDNLEEFQEEAASVTPPGETHDPYPESAAEVTPDPIADDITAFELSLSLDEDQSIFDSCFLEELKDILAESNPEVAQQEELPLDFLPYVLNEGEKEPQPYMSEVPIWELEVTAEILHSAKIASSEEPASLPPPDPVEIDWDSELASFEEKIISDEFKIPDPPDANEGIILDFKEETPDTDDALENPGIQEPVISDLTCPSAPRMASGESVFAELFSKSDRSAKLLLLDELLKIGDEKELYFLESLGPDEHPDVLNKAKVVRDELTARLKAADKIENHQGLENMEELLSQNEIELLHFEPILEKTDNDIHTELPIRKDSVATWQRRLGSWFRNINKN